MVRRDSTLMHHPESAPRYRQKDTRLSPTPGNTLAPAASGSHQQTFFARCTTTDRHDETWEDEETSGAAPDAEESLDASSSPRRHLPVLLRETLEYLDPKPGEIMVDATVGLGGHSSAIAPLLGPTGKLLAVDQDTESLALAEKALAPWPETVELVHSNFDEFGFHLEDRGIEGIDGLLADLGVSSPQLDVAERGFSFRQDGPLDMRMDQSRGEPAAEWINSRNAEELARIFWEYGEERASRRIAARIVDARRKEPFRTTTQLADLVRGVLGFGGRPRSGRSKGKPIDPATRVFQALRIAVNDELGALDRLLKLAQRWVKPGGRVVIISFHSLEDRRVKYAFREREIWEALCKKPVMAQDDELRDNPRSRSAKLRAARRLASAQSAR